MVEPSRLSNTQNVLQFAGLEVLWDTRQNIHFRAGEIFTSLNLLYGGNFIITRNRMALLIIKGVSTTVYLVRILFLLLLTNLRLLLFKNSIVIYTVCKDFELFLGLVEEWTVLWMLFDPQRWSVNFTNVPTLIRSPPLSELSRIFISLRLSKVSVRGLLTLNQLYSIRHLRVILSLPVCIWPIFRITCRSINDDIIISISIVADFSLE